jgi:hypothetical protein
VLIQFSYFIIFFSRAQLSQCNTCTRTTVTIQNKIHVRAFVRFIFQSELPFNARIWGISNLIWSMCLYVGCCSRVIVSRIVKWVWHVVCTERSEIHIMWKHEGKRSLGRHRCSWHNGNKIIITEIICEAVNCIRLDEDRDQFYATVDMIINFYV